MSVRRGTWVPGATSAPAAMIDSSSMTAPFRTTAAMPIRQWGPTRAPWSRTAWPRVTWSAISTGYPPRSTWMTVPSWMLVYGPIRMELTSPRITVWNQTLDCSLISTSPITSAVSAMKTVSWIFGSLPWKPRIMAPPSRHRSRRRESPQLKSLSAGRRLDTLGSLVLYMRTRRHRRRGSWCSPFSLEEPGAEVRLRVRRFEAGLRGAAAHLGGTPHRLPVLRRAGQATPLPRPVHPEGRRLVRDRLPLGVPEEGDGGREEVFVFRRGRVDEDL